MFHLTHWIAGNLSRPACLDRPSISIPVPLSPALSGPLSGTPHLYKYNSLTYGLPACPDKVPNRCSEIFIDLDSVTKGVLFEKQQLPLVTVRRTTAVFGPNPMLVCPICLVDNYKSPGSSCPSLIVVSLIRLQVVSFISHGQLPCCIDVQVHYFANLNSFNSDQRASRSGRACFQLPLTGVVM